MNKDTGKRTVKQIEKELEEQRLIKERKKIESKIKREKFLSENKDMTIFCRHCNEHLPVSEFSLVFRNKKGTPEFQCKKCKRRKRRIQTINNTAERGY